MKKKILTLTILSSALNINYAQANELVRATPDCKINVLGDKSLLSLNCLQVTELSNKELRGQIEKAVANLVTASQIKPLDKEELERSDNVQLDLNDSIVRELERRGNIRDVVSRGGTICF